MDSFKDLNIDVNKIEETLLGVIQKYDPEGSFSAKKTASNNLITITINNKEAKLMIYLKKNGTVTINPSVGKEKELSNEIAQHLKDAMLISERKNFSICLKEVDEEYADLLIDYLSTEANGEVISQEDIDQYKMSVIQGSQHDKITIKWYKTNRTLQLQGKPIILYREAYYYLSEILDKESIIEAQTQFYKCDIDASDIDSDFSNRFPASSDFLDPKIIDIIKPSLTIMKIGVVLSDYSLFVFPILRGLEGYIKQLFASKGIAITSDGFGAFFQNSIGETKTLTLDITGTINCKNTCEAITKSYNYFVKQRHSLFHIDGDVATSRIIESAEAAEEIISSVNAIIEETYTQIISA